MSFWKMLEIMLAMGIIGGIVNYLLPVNNPEPKKFLKPWYTCIILGIGATLLVPLFLEIAQSKLMEDIRFDCKWTVESKDTTSEKKETIKISILKDSIGKITSDTSVAKSSNPKEAKTSTSSSNTGKNYLLWAAYCLLAAAAGFKFINMLINNVVKEEQLNKAVNKSKLLEEDKKNRDKQNQLDQARQSKKATEAITKKAIVEFKNKATNLEMTDNQLPILPVIPVLPAVIHPDDPQKDRFGGEPEKNGRRLSATVTESNVPGFYKVTLIVESILENKPLKDDVIFYIHDSFSPSVFTYTPEEFKVGKAIEDEILSYGAFTVGVITDKGNTMLELDLAEDKNFPKEFRER